MSSASTPASSRPPLAALTGLRAVLALQVLFYHAFFTFGRGHVLIQNEVIRHLLGSGDQGVNAFFVLSGFVLAYAHVEDNGTMNVGTGRFYRARFARVYPMHFVGMLAALPLFWLQSVEGHAAEGAIVAEGAKEVLVSGTLTQAFFPHYVFALNGPAWSLSVEAVFYLAFPLVALAMRSLGRRGLLGAAVLAWGVALIAPLVHGLDAPPVERAAGMDLVVMFDPIIRMPELIFGFALGRLFATWPRVAAPPRAAMEAGSRAEHKVRGRWDWRFIAITFVLVFLLTRAGWLPAPLLHAGLLDPIWGLLIICAARSAIAEVTFGGRVLGLFGRASFSLYVLHKPVWYWFLRVAPAWLQRLSMEYVLAYVLIALTVALVFYRVVEEPARRWIVGSRAVTGEPSPRRRR